MRFACTLLFAVGPLVAAPVPKDFKKPDDQARLVGTWKARVLLLHGKAQTEITTHTFGFAADGKCHTLFGQGQRSDWTYTLDPTATPKRMRWVRADNPGTTFDCVYELTEDTLKLGFIVDGKPAPAVAPGPTLTLYEMTRVK